MKELELKVEGMMCSGCENRVQNALKNIEGVTDAKADHTSKSVKVIVEKEGLEDSIKECIDDLGYEVK